MDDIRAPQSGNAVEAAAFRDIIDKGPVSRGQLEIFLLSCCVAMVEGFDMQSMAFAAPEVARSWGVSNAAFGPIFSAALAGGVIGSFLVGAFGSRFRPKAVVLGGVVLFAVMTGLMAVASSLNHFLVLRFLAGMGLGAALPGLVAIVASYIPSRRRSIAVTFLISCQPLGGVVGGAMCVELIPALGWPAVFLLGLIWPLALLPWLIWRLPEPIGYLEQNERGREALVRLIQRFRPSETLVVLTAPSTVQTKSAGRSWSMLVADGRATGAVFLWCACMIGTAMLYYLVSWLPTILRNDGAAAAQAIGSSVAINAGSVIGALALSFAMDRFNPYRIVAGGYFLAAVVIAFVIARTDYGTLTMSLIFLAGFFGVGAQSCLTALIVRFYPPLQHTVAVASALVLGRIGAIAGPLVGSFILLQGGQAPAMFAFPAVAAIACAVAITAMSIAARKAL